MSEVSLVSSACQSGHSFVFLDQMNIFLNNLENFSEASMLAVLYKICRIIPDMV